MILTDEQRIKLVDISRKLAGQFIEYEYGAKISNDTKMENLKKIDCSGLTKWLYGQIGKVIPDGAYNQYNASKEISESLADIGCLVFKKSVKDNSISHVGMYIGNGWIVEAEGWIGSVATRPLAHFKVATTNSIYVGMRSLNEQKG